MGMFDEMLARLGESNVSDAEIRQIMEKAAKEAGVFADSAEAQAMLAKVMEAAQAKMGNKDILTDENAQPLGGFNAAYGVATRGDNAFQRDKPAEAFKEIEDIKNRVAALNDPATSYGHQARGKRFNSCDARRGAGIAGTFCKVIEYAKGIVCRN